MALVSYFQNIGRFMNDKICVAGEKNFENDQTAREKLYISSAFYGIWNEKYCNVSVFLYWSTELTTSNHFRYAMEHCQTFVRIFANKSTNKSFFGKVELRGRRRTEGNACMSQSNKLVSSLFKSCSICCTFFSEMLAKCVASNDVARQKHHQQQLVKVSNKNEIFAAAGNRSH